MTVARSCRRVTRHRRPPPTQGATIGGTVPMWAWIGEGATHFSY